MRFPSSIGILLNNSPGRNGLAAVLDILAFYR
jgi:hypothetical protein